MTPKDDSYDPGNPETMKRFQEQNQRLAIFTTLAIMLACTLVGACTSKRAESAHAPAVAAPVVPSETLVDVDQTAKPPTQRRVIPPKPEPFQKTPPCSEDAGETAIKGACYVGILGRKPPCGPILMEHNGACYRAVAKPERQPTSIQP